MKNCSFRSNSPDSAALEVFGAFLSNFQVKTGIVYQDDLTEIRSEIAFIRKVDCCLTGFQHK